MASGDRLYPNQQLRSVSLETFFKGHLSFLSRAAQVQDEFGDQLDNLFVPNISSGDAFLLRPLQLRPANHKESLALALNQASYVSFDYPGFPSFAPRALELVGRSLELLGVERLERVAFRYDNEMLIQRGDDTRLPVHELLRMPLPMDDDPADLVGLDLNWSSKWSKGQVGTRIWVEQANNLSLLKWTLSAMVMPAGSTADLSDHMKAAHDEALGRFERLITDSFRQFLLQGGEEQ